MDPEDRAEIGDMPRLQVSMKVRVIALSGVFLLVVALGLYASSPLVIRCLEFVKDLAWAPPDDQFNDTGSGGDEPDKPAAELMTFSILQDDFMTQDPHWFWRFNNSNDLRSITVKNGSLFLNLTEKVDDGSFVRIYITDREEGRGDRWLYVDLEIRLRCSDENGLEGRGKGRRSWGFMDLFPSNWQNSLVFRSISPESDPDRVGLQVCGRVDGEEWASRSISGVDIREWHNYTVLWRPGNATFLIDGEMVYSTGQAPSTPMGIMIYTDNAKSVQDKDLYTGFYLDLEVEQSIQIGHVGVSLDREYHDEYSNRMDELFANFSSIIEAVDAADLNSTGMRMDLDWFKGEWNETGYLHGERYMVLLSICDLAGELEEISGMFEEAREAIAYARDEGDERKVRIFKNYYQMAEKAWLEYDFTRIGTLLGSIINW